MSADVIEIRGLTAWARHGVLPHEKALPQPFVVDVDLAVDLTWAGTSDDLRDSVSYADVAAAVQARLAAGPVDLIERLAAQIADDALGHEPVESVTVSVHKPHAPVGVSFGDVAVRVHRRRRRTAVVALGANLPGPLGPPQETLAAAALDLHALRATRLRALSPLVASDALTLDGRPQPAYVNAVAVLETDLHPRTLLACLHEIEADHGRVREHRWGPRTLDLDLIDVRERDGRSLRLSGAVTLPHPGAAERDFVRVPWAAVEPRRVPVADGSAADSGVRPGPPWPEAVRRWLRVLGDAALVPGQPPAEASDPSDPSGPSDPFDLSEPADPGEPSTSGDAR